MPFYFASNPVQIRDPDVPIVIRDDPKNRFHFTFEKSLTMQDAERRWIELRKPTDRPRPAGLLCSLINDYYFSGLEFPPIFFGATPVVETKNILSVPPRREHDALIPERCCMSLDSDTGTMAETPCPTSHSEIHQRPGLWNSGLEAFRT
jgi:hypothetical protein